MGSILFVVANSGVLTAGETTLKSDMEGMGHTVTVGDDGSANNANSFDLTVVSGSADDGLVNTNISNIKTTLKGVMAMDRGLWRYVKYISNLGDGGNQSVSTIRVNNSASPLADGPHGTFTGNQTILTASATVYETLSNTGTGLVAGFCKDASSTTKHIGFTYPSSSALADSTTTHGRRVGLGLSSAAQDILTSTGRNIFKNGVAWAITADGVSATATPSALAVTVTHNAPSIQATVVAAPAVHAVAIFVYDLTADTTLNLVEPTTLSVPAVVPSFSSAFPGVLAVTTNVLTPGITNILPQSGLIFSVIYPTPTVTTSVVPNSTPTPGVFSASVVFNQVTFPTLNITVTPAAILVLASVLAASTLQVVTVRPDAFKVSHTSYDSDPGGDAWQYGAGSGTTPWYSRVEVA